MQQGDTDQPAAPQGQYVGQPPPGSYDHQTANNPPPQGQYVGQPPPGSYDQSTANPPPQGQYVGQPPPGSYAQPLAYPPPQGQYIGQPPPGSYGQTAAAGAGGGQGQQIPMVVTQQAGGSAQPNPAQWMPAPQPVTNCPPGLEYLTQIDQLLVHQQVELFEVVSNWETANRYQVKNSVGQQVYFAHEESNEYERQCCGPKRGFIMHLTDNNNAEVMRVVRDFKCCAGCCWCACLDTCSMEISIEAPIGQVVGYVKQTESFLAPQFDILNERRERVFTIGGPACMCQGPCCTGDEDFEITKPDDTQGIGKISKQWAGLMKEQFTKADNFGIAFPMDLDVKLKAVMLGAVFLIDFMFYEVQQNNNNNRRR